MAASVGCGSARAASPLGDLYRARAVVTGQGEAERARGFALCLEDVLVKVAGDPRLLRDPRLARLEAEAQSYVAAFDYRDRMAGIPVHDEQGTRDRPFDLFVTFDRAKIDGALRSLDLKPWTAERPRVVLFLRVRDGGGTYVLAGDGERGLGQRQSLQAAAEKRGVPILLPNSHALAAAGFTAAAGVGADLRHLDRAAKRVGGTLALAGELQWKEQALGWAADWHLRWRGIDHRWGLEGVSFDDAFRQAMEGAEQILSGHGRPQPLRH